MNPGQVRGTSKYIEDYTSAGYDMSKGHNFIAFKSTAVTGSTIVVESVGGESGPTTLDSDGIAVLQIVESCRAIKVTATKGSVSETKIFNIAVAKEEA